MGTATKTISYRYDANRNRTLMIDPEGGRTTYSYDVLNRVTQIINPQGERTTFAYDAKGRKTVKKLANGTRASFTYDAANRLTTLANLKSDNSVISQFDYKYDNVGNRTEVAEADGSRVTWSYDNTYQLLAEHRTGTSPYRNTFTYDKNGNRLVKNENNARTTYVYDAANQLKTSLDAQGTTTYVYDSDGNQERVIAPTGARTTTTWDYENKTTLVQLPSGIRNTMSYEPDGLRIKLEDSTGTKKFIFDEQNYLAEADENNDINVLYNNEPRFYGNLISQHRKSGAVWTPSFYHYEALGSTRQLTDDTEAVTDQYLYDAWGNVISSSGTTPNPFQFTGNVGYYFDVDTENQYIRARIYSPTIGRWLSVDPLWSIRSTNYYVAYFIPSTTDPSGLQVGYVPRLPPSPSLPERLPRFPADFPSGKNAIKCCNKDKLAFKEKFNLSLTSVEGRNGKRCPISIKCELGCGPTGMSIGWTEPPNIRGKKIDICIDARAGNFEEVLAHELAHASSFCPNGGRGPNHNCQLEEERAYRESCLLTHAFGTPEYDICVLCGVHASCDLGPRPPQCENPTFDPRPCWEYRPGEGFIYDC